MTTAVAVYPSYAVVPSPHPRPPSEEITLVALATAERFAGLFTKHAAVAWGFRPVANAAEHVAVELITRAVEITGNPDPYPRYTELLNPPPLIGIRVSHEGHGLLVEVWDSDPHSPLATGEEYLDQHLTAVHEISQRWNWYQHGGGKVIWAELIPAQAQPPEILPKRTAGRSAYPEPDKPVTPLHDIDILHAVRDGLHRLKESGNRREQL